MGGDHLWEWLDRVVQTLHTWSPAGRGQWLLSANHSRYGGGKMKRIPGKKRRLGFTLVELLVALGIFLIVTGAAFTLLGSSQQRYQTESQVLTSFQEARLGLDQIVRDVNDSGFPPPTFTDGIPSHANQFAISPFAWSPGYPSFACQIGTAGGGTCSTASAGGNSPGDFDVIIETNPNRQDPLSQVQWIRYQLVGTT